MSAGFTIRATEERNEDQKRRDSVKAAMQARVQESLMATQQFAAAAMEKQQQREDVRHKMALDSVIEGIDRQLEELSAPSEGVPEVRNVVAEVGVQGVIPAFEAGVNHDVLSEESDARTLSVVDARELDSDPVADAVDAALNAEMGSEVGAAGIFNAWSMAYDNATPAEKFETFKEAVLGIRAPDFVLSSEQHALDMAKMEAALFDVNIDDQAPLMEQLAQYHARAEHYNQLDSSAKGSMPDPVATLNDLIAKCELVDQLLGSKSTLASELQGEIKSVGGAEAFVEQQAHAMAFFAQRKTNSGAEAALVPQV